MAGARSHCRNHSLGDAAYTFALAIHGVTRSLVLVDFALIGADLALGDTLLRSLLIVV